MSENTAQLAEAIAALVAAMTSSAAPAQQPDTVLTVDEAAERLKISRSLVYRAIADGQLKSIRIGRRRLIPATEVDRLINSAV